MHTLLEALKNSILITGLVMIMMILIEYINIHSHGESFRKLRNSSVKQVFLAAALGLVPGCVGGFAVVSLYTHKLLSFGALVAMMIASSGDEAFIVMAMIPKTALLLFALLFVIGILAGLVTDKFVKKQVAPFNPEHYEIHQDCCDTYKHSKTNIFNHSFKTGLTKMTKERAFILAFWNMTTLHMYTKLKALSRQDKPTHFKHLQRMIPGFASRIRTMNTIMNMKLLLATNIHMTLCTTTLSSISLAKGG
jgi:hypothetical protein